MSDIVKKLGPKLKYGIKTNEPMSRHTSWQVGGPADYYLYPVDTGELVEIVRFSKENEVPLYVLGNGTNLLVLDGGIRGMVVYIGDAFSYIKRENDRLTAGAGTPVTYLARTAAEEGLTGLEFAIGIPGSLGGAIIMNAGAFGGYLGERVQLVKLISMDGEILELGSEECSFGYRTSNLAGKGIVVEVTLQLKPGDPAEAERLIEHYLVERSRRHPSLPSAGSVFRNLPEQAAGRLIEEAGGKGMRIGGAVVSEQHANFIVNTGSATAADILALIRSVQQLVKEKHGLELKPEVKIVGEER